MTEVAFTPLFDGHLSSDDDHNIDMQIDALFNALDHLKTFWADATAWPYGRDFFVHDVITSAERDLAGLRAALATLTRMRAAALARGTMV